MLFHSQRWLEAIQGVDEERTGALRRTALGISARLPSEPTSGDVDRIDLDPFRDALRAVRDCSPSPEHLPLPGEDALELALWAIGLAHHVRTS